MITEWLRHPVSKAALSVIKRHLIATRKDIQGEILNSNCFELQEKTPKLLQLKGQYHALEQFLDMKEFLSTETGDE